MSRTYIQQSQISGSLSVDVSDSYVAADALTIAENRTLVSDLNDLRKQLNRVIGEGSWSAALAGQQDLSDIYGAMHVDASGNADFMGTLDVTGVATFDAAITGSAGMKLAGDLDVNSSADFQGAVNMQSTLTVAGAADLNDALDVAGQVDLAAAGVATNVRGTLSVTEVATFSAAMTGSAGMQLAGDLDVNSSADFQGAVNLQDTLTVAGATDLNGALDVAGDAHFAGAIVDIDGTLSASVIKIDGDAPAGALYLVGAAGEIAEEGNLIFSGGSLSVTGGITGSAGLQIAGDMNVDGPAVMNDGLTVTGDRLEVTGSFGLTDAAEIGGTLDVDGAVTFGSSLEVVGGMSGSAGLKIAGDADFNSTADFAGAVNMQSTLGVTGAATFDGGLDVNGSGITATSIAIDGDVAGRLYIVDGSGYISDEQYLNFSGGELQVTGSLKVTAGSKLEGTLDVDGAADFASTLEVAGAVTMASTLDVDGAVDFDSTLNVAGNAVFQADVQVDGDLYVKGSTTYIQTENLQVKDAFIYLATGSNGGVDSGIVLSRGAGESHDLVIGQDGGAGEVVFAKVAYNAALDTPADINGAELVATWMSEVKFGAVEGSLSGSLAAVAGGIELSSESGKDISLAAGDAAGGGDLLLAANGETAISFIEAGEYAAFNAQFPGSSLVAAIVAAGGNFKQDSFKPGVTTAGASIDYSSVGALRSAAHADDASKKLAMDVFLNGVRLAYSLDYAIATLDGALTLTMNTMADDVLTVVIHNAATA